MAPRVAVGVPARLVEDGLPQEIDPDLVLLESDHPDQPLQVLVVVVEVVPGPSMVVGPVVELVLPPQVDDEVSIPRLAEVVEVKVVEVEVVVAPLLASAPALVARLAHAVLAHPLGVLQALVAPVNDPSHASEPVVAVATQLLKDDVLSQTVLVPLVQESDPAVAAALLVLLNPSLLV